ncbi:hypothetical protein EF294_09925 [Gordonia oryzae]|uniref:Uncharacterized protein n=1 Tax=Gordonia oryzae TaxID=2487349 RepID=A0A3N4HA52_9ACTN|nr:hypothetical protein EF294_09925 [Gordonia oryzae]
MHTRTSGNHLRSVGAECTRAPVEERNVAVAGDVERMARTAPQRGAVGGEIQVIRTDRTPQIGK